VLLFPDFHERQVIHGLGAIGNSQRLDVSARNPRFLYNSGGQSETTGRRHAVGKKAGGKKSVIEQVDVIEALRGERPRVDDLDWRTFDPVSLKGGVNAPLATELATYRDRLDDVLRHEGQHVVIKGREIARYFLPVFLSLRHRL
jgi:hypothetical protein